jgi:peptide/nickel transport system permease protein
MSNLAVSPDDSLTDASLPASNLQAPTPWLSQVWRSSISRPAAKLGLVWIVVVAVGAIFAPFIANSYPILVKVDGHWSSPLAQHLAPADVILPVLTVIALLLLWIKRWRATVRLSVMMIATIVVVVAAYVFVHPPQGDVYEAYRVLENEGKVQWVLHTPIPYSPGDRLFDQFVPGKYHPWSPGDGHWMGTEKFGADVASQMVHACRVAMAVGFIATGISTAIAIVTGGLMGYFAGLVDLLGMRLVEIVGSIPTIYLLLTFVAAFPDYRNIYLIMIIIGLTGWTGDARFVRAEFLKLRNQDFVQSATAAGLPLRSVLFKHILPNAVAPLLVSVSFGIAGAILSETTLSFLGLGIPVGDASWGALLNEAVSAGGGFVWWLATYPGIAIFLTVLAYNFLGEAVRDSLDPTTRAREG